MRTTRLPRTDKIRISPVRMVAMQASARRDAVAFNDRALTKSVFHTLFMEIMAYFHEHTDQAMPLEICDALSRVHDASQGLFVDPSVLFMDLHVIQNCEAGREHPKRVKAAIETLFAR